MTQSQAQTLGPTESSANHSLHFSISLSTSISCTTPETNHHESIAHHEIIMSARIPTSTSVSESAVIEASFSDVWHLIKLQDFSKFWSALEKSDWVKGTSDEADVVKWTFKDGAVVEVKQEEHSVRTPVASIIGTRLTINIVHRPLHHIQRHLGPARAHLLVCCLDHSRIPRHLRPARGPHIRHLVRQLFQRC
jgi:hypothetical protein